MENKDVRWIQRFKNFERSLAHLETGMAIKNPDIIQKAGMIQFFEMTFELAWNTVKDYYEHQGAIGIQGSRDAFRLAATRGLIQNLDIWMAMIESRVDTVHTYNEEVADEIAAAIVNDYHPLFIRLQTRLNVELQGS